MTVLDYFALRTGWLSIVLLFPCPVTDGVLTNLTTIFINQFGRIDQTLLPSDIYDCGAILRF